MDEAGPMKTFRLPDLAEGLTEAELLEWLVAVGDLVRAGQELARIETDKAQVDVASPWAGRIARLHAEVGARIRTGDALVDFDLQEDSAPARPREDAGTVVGELPVATLGIVEARGAPLSSAPRAVPAARARARELGIALDGVVATGPGDVITRADVELAAGDAAADLDAAPQEALRGVRLAMARNMARAQASVASATVMDEVDIEAWWAPEADVSQRLVHAMAVACSVEPALNAGFDERRLVRRLHERVDLAIAIQTREGLFAPVLRDVANVSAAELRESMDRLIAKTKARALRLADLRHATITLSNFGRLGGRHAMLVVVPPQVAILGAGRIEPRVVVQDGKPVVHNVLPLSLSFDHRAVTGAEAARFLAAVRADLERME
jgi:pyruvate dehydrogenase E2 component (dihydrolipoamide acetyltransferase)